MRRPLSLLLAALLTLSLLAGCGSGTSSSSSSAEPSLSSVSGSQSRGPGFSDVSTPESSSPGSSSTAATPASSSGAASSAPPPAGGQTSAAGSGEPQPSPVPAAPAFSLEDVPPYSGSAYVALHDNAPYFSTSQLTPVSREDYAPLDTLGRCGSAYACVGRDIMPTEERGSIGQVKPTGWHTIRYDNVDGKYLYNRCHLIGYQLSAENANTRNLITGTRYLNIEGMLPFENLTADYINETGNHVAYRVTPVFQGDDLLARGVLMEGWSVEDQGEGVCFCVFAYNVQPGIRIDYATGDSQAESGSSSETQPAASASSPAPPSQPEPAQPQEPQPQPEPEPEPQGTEYVLNTNTKKFHYPSCSSVDQMKESNKQYYTGTRDEVIGMGYDPCKRCNP